MKRSRKHAANARQISLVSSWAVESDCEVGVRAIKALRVAPPALRAADGLDRAAFECGLVSSRSRANRSIQGCKHLSGNVARKRGGLALVFSCPWSARPEPALWLKRHGKRPGGSLFPLGSVLGWPSRSCRGGCVERLRGRAYRWRRRHLRTAARPLSQLVGRRPLPPAILAIGQQTGRERPRPWFAMVVPGRSRGRSRPVCWCFCHRSCGLHGARRHDSQAHAEKTRHPPRR